MKRINVAVGDEAGERFFKIRVLERINADSIIEKMIDEYWRAYYANNDGTETKKVKTDQ